MSFNIVIRADASQAEADIKKVGEALKDVEASGQSTGNTVSAGMKKSHEATGMLGEKLESISKLGDALKAAIGFEFFERGFERLNQAIESYIRIHDHYIEMANAAYKFADAAHSVDDVIDEQIALAHDLHASLEGTREIYDRVKEGTEDLNFTHQEQITLTRVLGEQVQLANKPIGEASSLMERFSFAMQNGTLDGRTFTLMLREVPGIAKLLTEHFGTTEAGLRSLVAQGKLGASDIANALVAENGRSAESWRHHAQTIEGWKQEAVQSMELARARGEGYVDSLKAGIDAANGALQDHRDEIQKVADELNDLAEQTSKGRGIFGLVGVAENDLARAGFLNFASTITDGIHAINQGAYDASQALDQLGPNLVKTELDYMNATQNARRELEALNRAQADGVITGEAYRSRLESLLTTINGALPEAYKVMREVDQPAEKFERRLGAINELFAEGRLTIDQYNEKLREAVKTLGQPEMQHVVDLSGMRGAAAGVTDVTTTQLRGASQGAITQGAEYQYGTDAARRVADYRNELAALDAERQQTNLTDAQVAQLQENIRLKYVQMKTPAEELLLAQAALKTELDAHLLTQDQYNAALARTNAEYDHSALQGFKNALHALADESKNVAKDIEVAFKNAFTNLNGEIVNFVEGGKFDFAKLAKGIETDFLTMSLKQGEASLIHAVMPSDAGTGPAIGTSASASMLSAAPSIGAAIGAAFAATAAGAGAASGVAGGVAGAVAGAGGGGSAATADAISSARATQALDSRTAVQKTLQNLRPGAY